MKKPVRRRLLAIALLFVGIGLLGASLASTYRYVKTTRTGPTKPTAATVTTDSQPSEAKPAAITDSYTVPAAQPRLLSIGAIGVNSYIQKVGVTKDNAMATPNNLSFTGWYTNSVVPGDKGLSIINGHVSGWYSDGVFKWLKQLKPGDSIKVQMGDLSWRNFSVVSDVTYKLAEASGPLYAPTPGIDSELHLITCGGSFDKSSQEYDSRTIVVARHIA